MPLACPLETLPESGLGTPTNRREHSSWAEGTSSARNLHAKGLNPGDNPPARMRAAILGVGGNGGAICRALLEDPRVESIRLLDRDVDRAKAFVASVAAKSIEIAESKAEDMDSLVKALRGSDVLVQCTQPKYNVPVMKACLAAGVHYVDLAASGPLVPGEPFGILEQIGLGDDFRVAGVSALVSMGLDPGMTNVLARRAADQLDAVNAVRIRSGGVVNLPGFSYFPLYSRDAFIEDILVRPTVWMNGRLEERDPVSGEERYSFPPPVGPQNTYLVSHEEVKTLPRFLGKQVSYVDFKFAVDPALVGSLHRLWKEGRLSQDALTQIGEQLIPLRRTILESFPDPSAIQALVKGTKCVSVEVDGSVASKSKRIRGDIVYSHAEAARRGRTTAVYFLSAAAAAIGMALLVEGRHLPAGVHPAEALPPEAVLREWAHRGLPVAWSESTLP